MDIDIKNGQNIKANVTKIVEQLKNYNQKYYTEGKPIVTDIQYDRMKQKLQNFIKQNPKYKELADDVLNTVGTPTIKKGFKKAKHYQKMLSLKAIYDSMGYQKWLEEIKQGFYEFYGNVTARRIIKDNTGDAFLIQPKLDGLSIELIYKNGELYQAITRGNGEVGEDVTENIKATKDVPLKINNYIWQNNIVSVVGEVMIHKDDFKTYLSSKFSNPRNAAVGSLKQFNSSVIPDRHLKVYVFDYNIISQDNKYYGGKQHDINKKIEELSILNFRIPPFNIMVKTNEVIDTFNNMTIWRDTYKTEMDGIVIKINSTILSQRLGNKTTYPVGNIAWKFNDMVAESKIKKINWSVSKFGTLTPVAKVEPIDIGGVTVQNINLHNREFMQKMLKIKLNDTVKIRRAGDVIPEIVSVNKNKRNQNKIKDIKLPVTCPSCKKKVKDDGVNLKCINTFKCKEQIILRLKHFASKEALDINGVSIDTIRLLVDKYSFETPLDFYTFDYDKLKNQKGWGDKKIENIKTSIEKSRYTDMASLMYGMAIPGVGKIIAKQIVSKQTKFWELDELSIIHFQINGVGFKIAESIDEWNKQREIMFPDLMDNLLNELNIKYKNKTTQKSNNKTSQNLKNESVLFTGALNKMNKTRNEASELVKAMGGDLANTVNQCTILVVGTKAGSKFVKAQQKGKRIMYEDEFMDLCKKCGLI